MFSGNFYICFFGLITVYCSNNLIAYAINCYENPSPRNYDLLQSGLQFGS